MKLNEKIKQLKPIFKAYNLKPSRLKDFKKAQEIERTINSKVSNLISISGI